MGQNHGADIQEHISLHQGGLLHFYKLMRSVTNGISTHLFFLFQRISVVSYSQVIPVTFLRIGLFLLELSGQVTYVLLFSAVSNGCRCSSSLHHEALQQEVHLTEE